MWGLLSVSTLTQKKVWASECLVNESFILSRTQKILGSFCGARSWTARNKAHLISALVEGPVLVGDDFQNYLITCEQCCKAQVPRGFVNLPSGLMRSPLSFSHVKGDTGGQGCSLGESDRWLSSLGSIRSAGSSVILGGERDQCSLEFGVQLLIGHFLAGVTSQPPLPSCKHPTC